MRLWPALPVVCVLALVSLAAAEPPAEPALFAARGLSAGEIEHLARQLASDSEPKRADAFHALSELHAESLPGIARRLQELRKHRAELEAEKGAFAAIRHAAGSHRADENLDMAPGVLPALEHDRSAVMLAVVEPLLLLRALEHVHTRESALVFADVLLLDDGLWDAELRFARERFGLPLLPALITLRSHGDARVRNFAQAGVRALGMEDPALALKLEDPHLAAEVVRAYSEPLDFAALPSIVRLVRSDKLELREAARASVQRFGKNAIWQLRELYTQVVGKAAERGWDAERTARELYAVLDRDARAEEQRLLAQGMARFVAGDVDAMSVAYDLLLAKSPEFAEREKLAPGYAALGQKRMAEDKLDAARAAYARALRLAPHADDAEAIRGELAYIDAELALSHGVVDLHGYDVALRHAPSHKAAVAARDRLSGARAARERREKRIAAGAAIALLLGLIMLLLRERRRGVEAPFAAADDRSSA